MLNGHIHPTFLHTNAKVQPTETPTLHVIALFVPETNDPTKLECVRHIWKAFDRHVCGTYVHMCAIYEFTHMHHVTKSAVHRKRGRR